MVAVAATTVLLLLYVLRLRRRTLRWPSTLLWTHFAEDLEVNVPFQQLRITPLFLLQLLVLLLLLLAFAQPVIEGPAPIARRTVLLIDQSASMKVRESDGGDVVTRLDRAKERAAELVGDKAPDAEVVVIAFAARPTIVSGVETNTARLREAIDSIEPTDEEADFAAALDLAGAVASQPSETKPDAVPEVLVISDGGVRNGATPFTLRAGRFRLMPVGAAAPNVGVSQLSARRDYQDAARVIVFVELVNAGTDDVAPLVTLFVNGAPGPSRRIAVPGAVPGGAPGMAGTSFTIQQAGAALLAVEQSTPDALPVDDGALAVLPAPARPRIAVVAPRGQVDPALVELLREAEPAVLRIVDGAQFDLMVTRQGELARDFDLLVMDRHDPPVLPELPTICLGAVLPPFARQAPTDAGADRILSWTRRHPLLRHASLDDVVYAGGGGLVLPPEATALAYGPDGPVMATLTAGGQSHVVVGFELGRSNWATDLSIAIFMQNAIDLLWRGRHGETARVDRPGTAITVRPRPDASSLRISGPTTFERPVIGGTAVVLPPLREAGLYRVDGAIPTDTELAMSVLSAVESDVRPRTELVVNARGGAGPTVGGERRRPLWPWLVAAAMVLLVVEWLVYCRRIRGT